jgi:signal transduction histidine kinase
MNPIDLLGKIIEVSHSNLEIPSRIGSILNMISQNLRFEEALVYTVDKDKRLTCRYGNNKSLLFEIVSGYRCHVGEGVVGSVAQRRTPQHYTHKDVPPRFGCLFYPRLDGIIGNYKVFSFLPLSDDSYLYGVLVLISASRDSMPEAEKILLSIVGRELGGILRSNDLIVSLKKRISELATLSELGKILASNVDPAMLLRDISMIVSRALKAKFVTIKLDQNLVKLDSRFTHGVIDPPIEKHVLELEAEAVASLRLVSLKNTNGSDLEDGWKFSLSSSPMLSKDLLLGTITICGERTQPDFLLEGDGHYLISGIANYIASGLENILLNTKLKTVLKELGDAQKRLIEQEKFRSLGEMTANIAHEIKNPLVIIGGFTKRLAKKLTLDKTENRYADIIMKEVVRLEAILNEILDYVKDNPAHAESCNLNECLDEILYLFTSDAAWTQVEIIKEYDDMLPHVLCDGQQIKQVFINILVNSYEAMGGTGSITLRTGQTVLDGEPFVRASVTDNGGGIDPSVIENVFNPFFTTKERGTGLGLAISNKIVRNHGGHIEVENAAGKGVTFIVCLPVKNSIMKEETL